MRGRLVIIGSGHWGQNYVRVFSGLLGPKKVTVVDTSAETAKGIAKKYGVNTATSAAEVLADGRHKAAVVATPAATHYGLVKSCLSAGLDVLAEKPLTLKKGEARRLADRARRDKRILMVGHTFLYNPSVRKVSGLVKRGACGKLYYMKGTRTHLGLIRPDVNAVWDLAPHDISIFNLLTGHSPLSVSAMGGCYLQKGKEDVAFITLEYPGGVLANVHVSWADSNKERMIEIVGSRARIVFDDLNALESVKVYKKGISTNLAGGDSFGEFLFALRDGDIISPKVRSREPLVEVCRDFLRSVRTRKEPLASAEEGVSVVAAMCAVEESLKSGGRRVAVRIPPRRTGK